MNGSVHESTGWQSKKSWAIYTWARFLSEIFYGDLFLFFFDKNLNLLRSAVHVIAIDTSSACVCWQMASNSQYALPPQSSPLSHKKAQVVNPTYDQRKGSSWRILWLLVATLK